MPLASGSQHSGGLVMCRSETTQGTPEYGLLDEELMLKNDARKRSVLPVVFPLYFYSLITSFYIKYFVLPHSMDVVSTLSYQVNKRSCY